MAEQADRVTGPIPVNLHDFSETWANAFKRWEQIDTFMLNYTVDERELAMKCRVDDELKYSSQFFLDPTIFSLLRQYRDNNFEEIEQQERHKHHNLYNFQSKSTSQNIRPQTPRKRSARDAGDGRDADPATYPNGQEGSLRKRKLVAQSKLPAILASQKDKCKELETMAACTNKIGLGMIQSNPKHTSTSVSSVPLMSTYIGNLALPPTSSLPEPFIAEGQNGMVGGSLNADNEEEVGEDVQHEKPNVDDDDQKYSEEEIAATSLVKRYRIMADTLDKSILASLKDSNRFVVPIKYRWEVNYLSNTLWHQKDKIQADTSHVIQPESILSIAIYQPNRPHIRLQEFLVLGSQKLTALRDAIYCLSDFLTHGTDQSGDNVNTNLKKLSASFFFFENVFYVDRRLSEAEDYSKVILNWMKEGDRMNHPGLGKLESKTMDDFTFKDLTVRINHPYLFVHQGDCEHVMMIQDLRMVSGYDNQASNMYPLPIFRCKLNRNKCRMCGVYPAKYVTISDRYSGETPCYFCQHCYGPFHYDEKGQLLYDDYHVFPYSHD